MCIRDSADTAGQNGATYVAQWQPQLCHADATAAAAISQLPLLWLCCCGVATVIAISQLPPLPPLLCPRNRHGRRYCTVAATVAVVAPLLLSCRCRRCNCCAVVATAANVAPPLLHKRRCCSCHGVTPVVAIAHRPPLPPSFCPCDCHCCRYCAVSAVTPLTPTPTQKLFKM